MKRYLIAGGLIILFALVLLVGFKLSGDALAVIVGVGLGVLASVPTSFALAYVLLRQDRSTANSDPKQNGGLYGQQPPVVIVNGGERPGLAPSHTMPAGYPTSASSERTFTIVGEDTTEL